MMLPAILMALQAAETIPSLPASLGRAPTPVGDPLYWITTDMYPLDAVDKNVSGRSAAELYVGLSGHPYRCSIVTSSGSDSIDKTTCAAFMRSGRFEPALDENGAPIRSIWRRYVTWEQPPSRVAPQPMWDINIDVDRLPGGKKDASVIVRQVRDGSGNLVSCAVDRPSGITAIDRMACDLAKPLSKASPSVDEAGRPAATQRLTIVHFASPK